jgi:hypothetical protein
MEGPAKVRRHCPACGSDKLTRLNRTWLERMIGWVAGSRKYRCFICGHEFMARCETRGKSEAEHL